jgi:PPK2 family polyphosphate:nucleotide phosphotransferase
MDKYLVVPDKKIKLSEWDTRETSLWKNNKEDAKSDLLKINAAFEKLQELLFEEKKHRLLIVLQAMDTGGKDGVIRSVFEGVNPSGVRVASFKVPTQIEIDHDYLWRIHQQTPAKGEIVIFNRSHYEDVLVVRVHNLVDKAIWSARYDQINAFEKILSEEGTTIIKFFLHISKDEQKERLQERINIPEKRWKFSSGDLKERLLWDDYQKAYEDVLEKTSTNYAPWYLIPSDRNWYRDYLIGTILVEKLKSLKMKYPNPEEGIEKIKVI